MDHIYIYVYIYRCIPLIPYIYIYVIYRCDIYIYTIDAIDDFLLGLQELATTQAMNACEIKVDMSSIQKESGSA